MQKVENNETSSNEGVVNGKTQIGTDRKKMFSRKFLTLGVPIFSLLVIAGVVGLLVSGRLVWEQSTAKSTEQAVATNAVCNDPVVATYNKVSHYEQRDASGEDTLDEAGLKALVANVKGKAGYQADPTCQTIVLLAAIHDQDYEAAKQAYQAVKNLHDRHDYADSNLNTGGSLSAYKFEIQELSPSNKAGNNQEAQGGA